MAYQEPKIFEQPKNLPTVLLGYQKRLLKSTATHQVVVCEKSRRIGMTWAVAADAVLVAASNKAAGGMKVFYIGFNLDMTKEFIETSAMWAKSFDKAATAVEEFLFEDDNQHTIKAFSISFDSGFEIIALTSRPRSLRGRQGYVIIDEAAFHDDLEELLKAAMALLIWGGKVLVISTHDGVDNAFNKLVLDCKAGRKKYDLITVDFKAALNDGLYERVCFTRGQIYSKQEEDVWAQDIVDHYGDGADEELFCVPKKSGGTYLPAILIESRMVETPVIRLSLESEFTLRPDYERERFVEDWCEENLKPHLSKLDQTLRCYFGEDFGRSGDLTVLWPLQVGQTMVRRPPFVVELRNVPFAQQRQIVFYILDRLPRFTAGAMDGRGNGQQLAEETMQRYGAGRIFVVMTSSSWYLDALPKYKAALEDGIFLLPADTDIRDDHRLAVMQNGIPMIPETRTKGADKGKRHGDSLVAAAMAYWATIQEAIEYDYSSATQPRATSSLRPSEPDQDAPGKSKTFGNSQGAF